MHNKGIILADSVKAGDNLTLVGPLTIGEYLYVHGSASIGNNVVICTGARVIGTISIGDNVIVGANAVVVKDILDNQTVGGIPAKKLNIKT